MKEIFNKLRMQISSAARNSDHGNTSFVDNDESLFNPENIFRYRYQSGVNLGSWFVLERWITDAPFEYGMSPAQSDLDVAQGPNAREILENHWDVWIIDDDWDLMRSHGINSVRIPIGYYHLCGADRSVLDGTDFYPVHEVYQGAWMRITRAIAKAAERGIGVLLDLHAAPGKQNHDAHAGTSGPANFFLGPASNPHNQRCTINALNILATHLQSFTHSFEPPLPNVIGIELLNEPAPPSDEQLQTWYHAAINEIRGIDQAVPIYIGDCWRPETYAKFLRSVTAPRNMVGPSVVIDHHLYRCFTQPDISMPTPVHARALHDFSSGIAQQLAKAAEVAGRAGCGVVVGEWSVAMNPGSLSGSPAKQKAQPREWVEAQLALYDKTCAGWFFWTYKKQWRGDPGWSWRDAVEEGVFPDFLGVRKREGFIYDRSNAEIQEVLEDTRKAAVDRHTTDWTQHPGSYDHARFFSGYTQGWHDAMRFLSSEVLPHSDSRASHLGFKAAWAWTRTHDHGRSYWEYEAGFTQAADAAMRWYATSARP